MTQEEKDLMQVLWYFAAMLLNDKRMRDSIRRRGFDVKFLDCVVNRSHFLTCEDCQREEKEKIRSEIPQWLQLSEQAMQQLKEMGDTH